MLLLLLLLHEGHFPSRWWWKYFPLHLPFRAQLDYKKRSGEKITMSMQVHWELFNLTMDDTPTSNHPQWDGEGWVKPLHSLTGKMTEGVCGRQEFWVNEVGARLLLLLDSSDSIPTNLGYGLLVYHYHRLRHYFVRSGGCWWSSLSSSSPCLLPRRGVVWNILLRCWPNIKRHFTALLWWGS